MGIASSAPDEWSFTLGDDPQRNVDFLAVYAGRRNPTTTAEFVQWVEAEAASHGNSGRVVNSLANVPANCPSVAHLEPTP